MTMQILERYEADGRRVECGFVDHSAERGFNSYVDNVLRTVCNADAGDLAVWLTRQLDEWELEAERKEALPFAHDVIDVLEQITDAVGDRF